MTATPNDEDPRNELVERYLDQQSKEIAIRAQELEIERQKDFHNFEFGKAALEAQAQDRMHDRNSKVNELRHRHRLLIGLFLILAALILGAASIRGGVARPISAGHGNCEEHCAAACRWGRRLWVR